MLRSRYPSHTHFNYEEIEEALLTSKSIKPNKRKFSKLAELYLTKTFLSKDDLKEYMASINLTPDDVMVQTRYVKPIMGYPIDNHTVVVETLPLPTKLYGVDHTVNYYITVPTIYVDRNTSMAEQVHTVADCECLICNKKLKSKSKYEIKSLEINARQSRYETICKNCIHKYDLPKRKYYTELQVIELMKAIINSRK